MRKYRVHFAILLVALATIATLSVLYASSDPPSRYDTDDNNYIGANEAYVAIQDHYAGALTQDETVDLLLRYWGDIPVTTARPGATPTPTPQPTMVTEPQETPSPTPTPTPEPTPTATPVVRPAEPLLDECFYRWEAANFPDIEGGGGYWEGQIQTYTHGIRAAYNEKRNVEVIYVNRDDPKEWEYGFQVHDSRPVYGNSASLRPIRLTVNQYGQWMLKQQWVSDGYKVVESGRLADLDIPFNGGPGERNQLTYFAGDEKRTANNVHTFQNPSFWVNGHKVPVDFQLVRYNGGTGTRYSGSVKLYSPYTSHDDLCAIEAWRQRAPE